ncbi:Leucine aminopeptidase A, partial [Frankliniella fusca]
MPVPCVCGKRPIENDGYCKGNLFEMFCFISADVEKWFCPTCTRETDIFQKMDSKLEELKAYIDSKYANLSKSICE